MGNLPQTKAQLKRAQRAEAPAQHPAPADPPAGSAIRVDLSQLELLDIPLLGEFDNAETLAPAEQFSLVQRAIPMFDRLVVGGLKGYKFDQLQAVVEAVSAALRERSDAKN